MKALLQTRDLAYDLELICYIAPEIKGSRRCIPQLEPTAAVQLQILDQHALLLSRLPSLVAEAGGDPAPQ